jgi:PPOX class probable F420-dependent enzyme
MLDPKVQQLCESPNFAARVTLMPDGSPQCQMTWIDHDGEHILFNTERERQVFKNITKDPRVSIMVFENGYSYAEIRGTVVETVGGEEALAHINKLSERYMGKPYSKPIGPTGRVLCKVRVEKEIVK